MLHLVKFIERWYFEVANEMIISYFVIQFLNTFQNIYPDHELLNVIPNKMSKSKAGSDTSTAPPSNRLLPVRENP